MFSTGIAKTGEYIPNYMYKTVSGATTDNG